jgi:hypothetical protein
MNFDFDCDDGIDDGKYYIEAVVSHEIGQNPGELCQLLVNESSKPNCIGQ